MERKGYLVISLDLELLWGVFDKVDYKERISYFKNTRKVIPQILDLFEMYDIHCTWATVGMLFNSNWEEWNSNIPKNLPAYDDETLSSYEFGKSINSTDNEFYCFARNIIQKIYSAPNQEIGTHTYSHYYCHEPGQTVNSFRDDLQKCMQLAQEMNIHLKSLVFPRNQFNEEYLTVCHELGIENVRSNPDDWYWKNTQKDSLKTKIFRTGDAYIGPANKSYSLHSLKEENGKPFSQKASRLLRPYSPNRILNTLKLNRIQSEMTAAARKKEVYHLWWHPHNFGNFPQQNLSDLKSILDHFSKCKKKYNFGSLNMNEVNKIFSAEKQRG